MGDVLEWVDDDPERALEAFLAESEGKGRKSLLEKLEEIGDFEPAEDEEQPVDDAEPEDDVASEASSNNRIRRVFQGTPYVRIDS